MQQDLVFSGKNRRHALNTLKRHFDEVAAQAQGLSAGTIAKQPLHKIVLIEAERG